MNRISLGICLVGNFDAAPPTDGQLAAAARVIREWMRLFAIPPENVHPHRLYAPKTCPGTAFTGAVMQKWVNGINEGLWK